MPDNQTGNRGNTSTSATDLDAAVKALQSIKDVAEHYRATSSATSRDWAVAGTFLAIAITALEKLPQNHPGDES